jgi:hypothetical protein
MKLVIVLLFLVAIVSSSLRDLSHKKEHRPLYKKYTYDRYLIDFEKTIDSSEYEWRKEIFETRMEEIRSHNHDTTKTWKLAVNHLTDRTPVELKSLRGRTKALNPVCIPFINPHIIILLFLMKSLRGRTKALNPVIPLIYNPQYFNTLSYHIILLYYFL